MTKKPRNSFKGAQTLYVSNDQIIFKLCDWGIARIAKIMVDKTQTIINHDCTEAFAAPELYQEEKHINLEKIDIYSLGCLIITCCGMSKNILKSLNLSENKQYHNNRLNDILTDFKISEEYGNDVVKLIKNMLSFDHGQRYNINEVEASLKEIVLEIKKDFCEVCSTEISNKKHQEIFELACKHMFHWKCFEKYIVKYDEFLIKCPIEVCSKIITKEKIEEFRDILENESEKERKHNFICENELVLRICASLGKELDVESAFMIFDQDQDELINFQDFRITLLVTLNLKIDKDQIELLYQRLPSPLTKENFVEFFGKYFRAPASSPDK